MNAATSTPESKVGGAGIGGEKSSENIGGNGGTIMINGRLVTAVGGREGAGIGGGCYQDSGNIIIGGDAVVIARGGIKGGAGIGGGFGVKKTDGSTIGGNIGTIAIGGNSIVFAGTNKDLSIFPDQDLGFGNRGSTYTSIIITYNAAVFLHRNLLCEHTAISLSHNFVGTGNYETMSRFGINLESFYPDERPVPPGSEVLDEPHLEGWLSDLWDEKVIDWWKGANGIGAYIVHKILTYRKSADTGAETKEVM